MGYCVQTLKYGPTTRHLKVTNYLPHDYNTCDTYSSFWPRYIAGENTLPLRKDLWPMLISLFMSLVWHNHYKQFAWNVGQLIMLTICLPVYQSELHADNPLICTKWHPVLSCDLKSQHVRPLPVHFLQETNTCAVTSGKPLYLCDFLWKGSQAWLLDINSEVFPPFIISGVHGVH